MKKNFLILLLAIVCCLGLVGCQNSDDEQTETHSQEQADTEESNTYLTGEDLAEAYPLECKEILIVTDMDIAFDGEEPVDTYEITDRADIDKIVTSANLANWNGDGDFYASIYSWTVVFDGKIAMRFANDFSYCAIGKAEKHDDGTYIIAKGTGEDSDYDVPAEFSEVLQNMLAKYSNQ